MNEKKKTELKTLKDFDVLKYGPCCHCKDIVEINELKQEAIKYLRFNIEREGLVWSNFNNEPDIRNVDENLIDKVKLFAQREFIERFFNITEGDLK